MDDLCEDLLRGDQPCMNRWKYKLKNRDGRELLLCGVHYRKLMNRPRSNHWRLIDVLPLTKGK